MSTRTDLYPPSSDRRCRVQRRLFGNDASAGECREQYHAPAAVERVPDLIRRLRIQRPVTEDPTEGRIHPGVDALLLQPGQQSGTDADEAAVAETYHDPVAGRDLDLVEQSADLVSMLRHPIGGDTAAGGGDHRDRRGRERHCSTGDRSDRGACAQQDGDDRERDQRGAPVQHRSPAEQPPTIPGEGQRAERDDDHDHP